MTTEYPIGTQYKTRDKRANLCTVTDILKTYNFKGDLVKTCYVSTHEFCGQIVTNYEVPAVSIARGLIS